MWDHLPIEVLIEQATTPAGLARPGLTRTLMEIRALPETEEKP